MTYEVVVQTPETPIGEEWKWETDLIVSYNGTEDPIPLLRYPKRIFKGDLRFDDLNDLRRHIAMMQKRFEVEFKFPLFQYQAKLKAAVTAGADSVTVNARRGNFKVGEAAIIIEDGEYEEVEIEALTDTTVTFVDPLANSYSTKAFVCPLSTVFANTNASVVRNNPDDIAKASFTYIERLPVEPFIGDLNEAELTTFDSLPVLDQLSIGTDFQSSVSTGLQAVEFLGGYDVVSPWDYMQWGFPVRFRFDNFPNVDGFEWWQLFAETIQGSQNPFLFPTNRADMEIVTPAALGGTGITVLGDEYSQHYWEHGGFSRIFIDSDAGRHYAKITGISSIAGNDRLTFTPALPGGAGWNVNQSIGFLLKCRNEDDRISLDHFGLYTEVTLAIRTVV